MIIKYFYSKDNKKREYNLMNHNVFFPIKNYTKIIDFYYQTFYY